MHEQRVIEFGMEGGDQLMTLTGSDDVAIDHREHLYPIAHRRDVRSADEGHRDGGTGELIGGVEAAELAAVGVAQHGDIHGAEVGGIEHDEAGTGAEHREPVLDGITDGLEQPEVAQQAQHGGALAAGDDEGILRLLPVGELTHFEGLDTEAVQDVGVLDESALEG